MDPEEEKEEKNKFKEVVSDRVEFGPFKIYRDNVEWGGMLVREGIEFVFSLDDTDGVYITSDMLQLRETTLETLNKLKIYHQEWSKEWAIRLSDYIKPEEE